MVSLLYESFQFYSLTWNFTIFQIWGSCSDEVRICLYENENFNAYEDRSV